MPIYQYECACGQVLEIQHPMSEDPDIECNNCDGMMERRPSVPQIRFKGKGFYSTDK